MTVQATIKDIRITGTWEGEAELACTWRGQLTSFMAGPSSCFWATNADGMPLEEALKPETWVHAHEDRYGNPLAPDPGHSVE